MERRSVLNMVGRTTSIIIMLIFFVFGLAGKDALSQKVPKKQRLEWAKLTIPRLNAMSFLPFRMGAEKGLFAKEGINLEVLSLKSAIGMAALLSRNVDYTAVGGRIIRAAAIGGPVRLVSVVTKKFPHGFIVSPRVASPKDLKGKTIAVQSMGSTEYYAARSVIEYYGLDPDKDATIMGTGFGAQLPALFSGSVDAAVLVPSELLRARARGFKVLTMIADVWKYEVPTTGLGTTVKNIKENRSQVKRMIRGQLISVQYLLNNKEDVVTYMTRDWGITDRNVLRELYDLETKPFSRDGSVPDEGVIRELEMGRKLGLEIKEEVSVSDVTDFSMLKEAQKELGLAR
jgi:ABC-type nitrate/sulfonate/bicarbonate transport system substrate-binding protein